MGQHVTLHIAVVTGGVPNPDSGGHMITHWSIINWLLRQGHKVTVIAILPDAIRWVNIPRRIGALQSLGVEVIEMPMVSSPCHAGIISQLRRLLPLPFEVAFPTRKMAVKVQSKLREIQPDVVLAGHYEGLAATYRFRQAPIMTLFGDPYHLSSFYRWWHGREDVSFLQNVRNGLSVFRLYLGQVPRLKQMMQECAALGATAAHHAAWYTRVARRPCLYLPSPVEDRAGPNWRERRENFPPNRPPKILSMGPLNQTANRPGIRMFVREVVPVLDAHLGPDGYEVHFVGRSEGAPRELVELAAKRPNIKIRGFVDSADEEFLSADILLALNPVRLGNRLRIASAFSFGCCVVSHSANQCGMPELRHEYNVLLAEKAKDIALALVRALSDESLRRRLGENGRRTYEDAYSDLACAKIEAHLIRIAGIRSR